MLDNIGIIALCLMWFALPFCTSKKIKNWNTKKFFVILYLMSAITTLIVALINIIKYSI